MRIVVTGGTGFFGRYLCQRLREEGHEVTVLDDLSTGKYLDVNILVHIAGKERTEKEYGLLFEAAGFFHFVGGSDKLRTRYH